MMSSSVLNDQSFIANHSLEYGGFLNFPLSNITELFLARFGLFSGMRS